MKTVSQTRVKTFLLPMFLIGQQLKSASQNYGRR